MEQTQLREWIERHGLTCRAFLSLINEVRLSKGHKGVTIGSANKWLYQSDRHPPAWVEEYLPLIELKLNHPEAIKLYQVPVNKKTDRLLSQAARRAGIAPEALLKECFEECLQREFADTANAEDLRSIEREKMKIADFNPDTMSISELEAVLPILTDPREAKAFFGDSLPKGWASLITQLQLYVAHRINLLKLRSRQNLPAQKDLARDLDTIFNSLPKWIQWERLGNLMDEFEPDEFD